MALARVLGPRAGLAAVDAVASDPTVARYYSVGATRGELLLEGGPAGDGVGRLSPSP